MSPSIEFGYAMEEAMAGIVSALFATIPSGLLGIASYVLTALALYTLAQRRGISKPWLSWIPVVNVWILGSLSDQYRYVVKGENKSKRKILLVLSILSTLLTFAVILSMITMIVTLAQNLMYVSSEEELIRMVMNSLVSMFSFVLPLAAIGIAKLVIHFMALYDVYGSMDPSNRTLFLVLSILFNITQPFFLFFNRHKDQGMPPRRQEPVYVPQQPQWQPPQPPQEPWEQPRQDDYL